MALTDYVTLPLRVGVAATQVSLALGELVAPEGPLERLLAVDGALDRITKERCVLDRMLSGSGPLDKLAGRLPKCRRRSSVEA